MKPDQLPPDLAELDAIAAAADAQLDTASALPGAPGADQADPEPTQAEQLAGVLQLAVMTLAPALPFLPQCYPPEICKQIGVAAGAVCDKHGWKFDAMPPELALAAIAIPPTVQAVVMGRAHFAQQRAQASSSSSSPAQQLQPVDQVDERPHAGIRQ